MGEIQGYTGRIHTKSEKVLPWIAKARWEQAGYVMRQRTAYNTAIILENNTYGPLRYVSRHSETENPELFQDSQQQICLMLRSYIQPLLPQDITLPTSTALMLQEIANLPWLVELLDARTYSRLKALLESLPQPVEP